MTLLSKVMSDIAGRGDLGRGRALLLLSARLPTSCRTDHGADMAAAIDAAALLTYFFTRGAAGWAVIPHDHRTDLVEEVAPFWTRPLCSSLYFFNTRRCQLGGDLARSRFY